MEQSLVARFEPFPLSFIWLNCRANVIYNHFLINGKKLLLVHPRDEKLVRFHESVGANSHQQLSPVPQGFPFLGHLQPEIAAPADNLPSIHRERVSEIPEPQLWASIRCGPWPALGLCGRTVAWPSVFVKADREAGPVPLVLLQAQIVLVQPITRACKRTAWNC